MAPVSQHAQRDAARIGLLSAGWLLLVAGVVHVGVWIVFGGPMAGPVSWRKPILFCFASGVTCLSIAWVYAALPKWKADRLVAWLFAVAIVAEVALICLQQWRGVPSHFNSATPFDGWVLFGIKGFVTVVTLAIAYFSARSFGRLNLSAEYVVAARAGMVLLLLACLLGFVIEVQGERLAADGLTPSVYGEAGVLKFPHGMPLHAIQYLPLTAWLLGRLGVEPDRRRRSLVAVLVGVCGLTLYALLQSYSGRGRFEVTPTSATLLVFSVAWFAAPVAYSVAACARRLRAAPP